MIATATKYKEQARKCHFRRRSRTAFILDHEAAHFARLVGENLLDPGAEKDDDASERNFGYHIVTYEGRDVLVAVLVGPEDGLDDCAVIGPFCRERIVPPGDRQGQRTIEKDGARWKPILQHFTLVRERRAPHPN